MIFQICFVLQDFKSVTKDTLNRLGSAESIKSAKTIRDTYLDNFVRSLQKLGDIDQTLSDNFKELKNSIVAKYSHVKSSLENRSSGGTSEHLKQTPSKLANTPKSANKVVKTQAALQKVLDRVENKWQSANTKMFDAQLHIFDGLRNDKYSEALTALDQIRSVYESATRGQTSDIVKTMDAMYDRFRQDFYESWTSTNLRFLDLCEAKANKNESIFSSDSNYRNYAFKMLVQFKKGIDDKLFWSKNNSNVASRRASGAKTILMSN